MVQLHMLEVHRKFQCSDCSYSDHNNDTLQAHIIEVHRKPQKFPCSEVPIGNPQKFQCSDCSFSNHSEKMIQHHYNYFHLGMRRFKCGLCEHTGGLRFINLRLQISYNTVFFPQVIRQKGANFICKAVTSFTTVNIFFYNSTLVRFDYVFFLFFYGELSYSEKSCSHFSYNRLFEFFGEEAHALGAFEKRTSSANKEK